MDIKTYTISALTLGSMFKKRRKQLGLTAAVVASKIGVTSPLILQLETGVNIMKKTNKIAALCHVLCDDGTLMAHWLIAYNELRFFSEDDLAFAVESIKVLMRSGPLSLEVYND